MKLSYLVEADFDKRRKERLARQTGDAGLEAKAKRAETRAAPSELQQAVVSWGENPTDEGRAEALADVFYDNPEASNRLSQMILELIRAKDLLTGHGYQVVSSGSRRDFENYVVGHLPYDDGHYNRAAQKFVKEYWRGQSPWGRSYQGKRWQSSPSRPIVYVLLLGAVGARERGGSKSQRLQYMSNVTHALVALGQLGFADSVIASFLNN